MKTKLAAVAEMIFCEHDITLRIIEVPEEYNWKGAYLRFLEMTTPDGEVDPVIRSDVMNLPEDLEKARQEMFDWGMDVNVVFHSNLN